MRFFDAILRWAAILILVAGLKTLHAQVSQNPITPSPIQTRPPAMPGAPNHNGMGDEDTPLNRQMEEQQAIKRNSLRQQQIVDDTAKLLSLAQQLKEAVDKSTKNTLSLGVVKKAEEIEKLAKTVKEKMREGQ
jgi:hypothetical protein